jgi:hypothetical protein
MPGTPTIPGARKRVELDVSRRYLIDKDDRDAPPPSDELYKFGEKESRRISYWDDAWPRKDEAHQLEVLIRALAQTFAEKPRWQRIIEHANTLADELGVPRERFYADALVEFIEKTENERLIERYERIQENEEDIAFLNHAVRHYDPRLADE